MANTAVTIALTAANGLFTQTTYSGNVISLAPQPLFTSFLGDSSVWEIAGAAWTINGDQLTMDNTDSGNNYIGTIYPVNQLSPADITFRLMAIGENIESGLGNDFGISLILTDAGGLSGTTLADVSTDFPSGSFTQDQFSVTASPVLPAPAAPTLAASASGGSIAAGTAYVVVTALNANGETIESNEAIVPVTGPSGSVVVTITAVTGATSYNVYAGSATGVEFISGNTTTTSYTVTTIPTTGATPPTTNTAKAAVAYIYAYVFARNGTGKVTAWDAEVFQVGGTAAVFGSWQPKAVDLWAAANQPITTSGLALIQWKFYYADMSNVDNAYSVEHSINVLSLFPNLVCNEPGQNTGRAPEVQQQLVALGIDLYGYCQVGASGTAPTLAAMEAIMDRCAAAGYVGVFFDMFGYDWGVTRATQNAVVNYAHSKGLHCVPNAWNPPDALASIVDATYNPTGVPPALTRGDWYLFESFLAQASGYEATGGFAAIFAKYAGGVQLAQALGVSTLGLTYQRTVLANNDYSDWLLAYVLASGLGVDGLAYNGDLGANDMQWTTAPTFPAIGSKLITPMVQTSATTYEAITDAGVVQFTAVDSPVSRSYSSFASGGPYNVTIFSQPTTAVTNQTIDYQQSADGLTWVPTALNNVTARYLQETMKAHS